MPKVVRALLGSALLTAAAVGTGVATHSPVKPVAAPVMVKGTLADADTTLMHVRRGAFCNRVPTSDVTAALGGRAVTAKAYRDGDKAQLTATFSDVSQEWGCTWAGPRNAEARAWVFAPPVTQAWANRMTAAPVDKGCKKQPGPAYGKPSTALACTTGKQTTVTLHGLFGDAWLACQLTGAPGEKAPTVRARASRWCLVTATAAG